MRDIAELSLLTTCNATTVREVVRDNQAQENALAMRDLYKSCVSQVIADRGMNFHVLMMPSMTGHHYTYALRDEDDLAQHVADLLNTDIMANDCLVILGHDILSQDLSEDQMLQIVLQDISLHIERLYPVTDRETGWFGHSIGWSAIASVIASAHPIMRTLGDGEGLTNRIADSAHNSIVRDFRSKSPDLEYEQHRPAYEAIERVCDLADKDFGGYISLPTTAAVIHAVAQANYHEAVNCMPCAPRALI